MDDDTNYEGEDHYHRSLKDKLEEALVSSARRAAPTSVLGTEIPEIPEVPVCSNCSSDDVHSVYFGVDNMDTYQCNDCGNVTATIVDDEPSGVVSGDLPEAAEEDAYTHYTIIENGHPVGAATDKGYHHHISIPYLGFETVKESVKNWAVETGYTLEVKE